MNINLIMAVRDGRADLSATQAHVLLVLATFSKHGTDAFPSIETLAKATRLAERSISRTLMELQNLGAIRAIGGTKGGAGKTTKYAFVIEGGADETLPQSPPFTERVTLTAKNPATESPEGKTKEEEEGGTRAPACEGFAEFWEAYPKKVAVADAAEAFAAARQRATLAEILHGVARYVADREGKDSRYTANPANWLKGNRWADEIPTPGTENSHGSRYRSGKTDKPSLVTSLYIQAHGLGGGRSG